MTHNATPERGMKEPLFTEEQLVGFIQVELGWTIDGTSETNGMLRLGHHIIDFYESRLALIREENRWIPVKERLPEDSEEVLAATISNSQMVGVVYALESGTIVCSDSQTTMFDITHWRPLPSAPTSDNNVVCPKCQGNGYTIEVEAECCFRPNENGTCCGNPDPVQVQVKCQCSDNSDKTTTT
jgi:hypothetical protein